MPYSLLLSDRIRRALGMRPGLTEKKMFGGIGFMINGNMCCGVHGENMIVRLDAAQTDAALSQAHTRPFDMTGKPMKGWILVEPGGLESDEALAGWVETAVKFAAALPPK